MELVSHTIGVKSRQSDEILLMPVGDIQWAGDDKEVALKMLKRHIAWGVKNNAYFIGMGDYVDTFSPSNRQRLKSAAMYDTAQKAIDTMAEHLVDELYEKALKPSKGRWLGLHEGHHFHEFRDGTTSDMRLAKLLDAPHLGSVAMSRLVMTNGSKHGSIEVWSTHGNGGGKTEGATLNRFGPQLKVWDADIFLMAHDTQKAVKPIDKMRVVYPKKGKPLLVHRTVILAGTGGFMRGYIPGNRFGKIPRGNYVEQGTMAPVALGGVLIRIRPRWKKVDGHDIWSPDLSGEA